MILQGQYKDTVHKGTFKLKTKIINKIKKGF